MNPNEIPDKYKHLLSWHPGRVCWGSLRTPTELIRQGWPALVSHLQSQGYRMLCVHPYPVSFCRRDTAYPRMGFSEAIDIRHFPTVEYCGPYVCDAAVVRKVDELVKAADGPLFIFFITMENHGPLHLESISDAEVKDFHTQRVSPESKDLTVYLRHLRHADAMIADLKAALMTNERPASLCWFGDHVPIMPTVYETLGTPDGRTNYVVWHKPGHGHSPVENGRKDLVANQLADHWLRGVYCQFGE